MPVRGYPGIAPIRRRFARMSARSKAATAANPQLSETQAHNSAGLPRADDVKLLARRGGTSMQAVPVLKRAAGLTSDAILLTIASPFFAIWWLTRQMKSQLKRMTQPKD